MFFLEINKFLNLKSIFNNIIREKCILKIFQDGFAGLNNLANTCLPPTNLSC